MSDPTPPQGTRADRPPLDVQHTMALFALLGRAGATDVELGWLNDEKPWRYWARARFKGTAVISEDHAGGDFALEGLARRVIHQGRCVKCGRKVSYPHLSPGYCARILVRIAADVLEYMPLCELKLIDRVEVPGPEPSQPDLEESEAPHAG